MEVGGGGGRGRKHNNPARSSFNSSAKEECLIIWFKTVSNKNHFLKHESNLTSFCSYCY